ncbi:hypothetical protein I858_005000 [Planococcus versutus]|uniref:N-acetyltransferase domain-containing protein n=2 Tax=Planococcus versutus TaxID=1302659 RepID=A0A1B1RZN1_9BACL|nr:hypothetical protein I858_005000 [Planococcus versutus]
MKMTKTLNNKPFIRHAKPEDGERIVTFYNKVGGETDYLSFGLNEYPQSAADLTKVIEQTSETSSNCIFIVLEKDKVIGVGTIDSSPKRRYRHVGTLGIVISQLHTGKGVGRVLMTMLINCAKENKRIEKISLVTRADNKRAIVLYENVGFIQEGLFGRDAFDG